MADERKPHMEFLRVDLDTGWETPDGYPTSFTHKILTADIDENKKVGSRSRLMRLAPGAFTKVPFVHTHWEEVYLLDGDLIVGNDENGEGGDTSSSYYDSSICYIEYPWIPLYCYEIGYVIKE